MSSTPPTAVLVARASDRSTVVEVHDRLYLRLDAEGRWSSFGEGGAMFRRTVDGRVVRPREGGFETLGEAEAETVGTWVVRRSGELLEALQTAPAEDVEVHGDREALLARLRTASCLGEAAWAAEHERYARAYPEPVPILPPHRYRDLVVMPATGCPNHRCAFCAFYRDRPFRVLDAEAFDAHLAAVRRLFGQALAERDGIFLGSASALTLPDEVLHDRLGAIARALGVPRRGIASFHDPDRGPRRDTRAWSALSSAGLVEAMSGLETADGALRSAIGKSDDLGRYAAEVRAQKEAGLRLSVSVLLGLGGSDAAEAHRAATVPYLASLPLGPRDFVYLSLLRGALPPNRLQEERLRWRSDLDGATAARLGDYRVERFAWLT